MGAFLHHLAVQAHPTGICPTIPAVEASQTNVLALSPMRVKTGATDGRANTRLFPTAVRPQITTTYIPVPRPAVLFHPLRPRGSGSTTITTTGGGDDPSFKPSHMSFLILDSPFTFLDILARNQTWFMYITFVRKWTFDLTSTSGWSLRGRIWCILYRREKRR